MNEYKGKKRKKLNSIAVKNKNITNHGRDRSHYTDGLVEVVDGSD